MWVVYILRCKNNSLYTGITNDIERRVRQHKAGKASRITRALGVAGLVYKEPCRTKGLALKREAEIKRFPRSEKLRLIKKK